MRRLTTLGLATAILIPTLGCSSMTVRADHDSQNDFGAYSTFAVFERQGKESRRPQMSPIVDQRIGVSMAAELEAKGFASTSARKADFLVTFYTAIRRRVAIASASTTCVAVRGRAPPSRTRSRSTRAEVVGSSRERSGRASSSRLRSSSTFPIEIN